MVTALVVVLLLGFVLRWVFGTPRQSRRIYDATDAPDLGLLTVVASRLGRQDALARRAELQAAGIRSSMSRRRDGTQDVLVFNSDADRARTVLNG
jgi:hypothetical protein